MLQTVLLVGRQSFLYGSPCVRFHTTVFRLSLQYVAILYFRLRSRGKVLSTGQESGELRFDLEVECLYSVLVVLTVPPAFLFFSVLFCAKERPRIVPISPYCPSNDICPAAEAARVLR